MTRADYVHAAENGELNFDVYFEDGKLFYEKRWYERGQQIYVENKENVHYFGGITAINTGEVCCCCCNLMAFDVNGVPSFWDLRTCCLFSPAFGPWFRCQQRPFVYSQL